MAATADRSTAIKFRQRSISLKVKAATKLYMGTLIAVDATGFAVAAADAAAHRVIGVADETVDNLTGASGDKAIRVAKGVFKFANAGDAVVQADIGLPKYVSDNQTVRTGTGTNSIVAGVVDEIDADGGIWVAIL